MAMTLRLKPAIQERARAHCETVGVSMNVLVALALANYLDFHEARTAQRVRQAQAVRPQPAAVKRSAVVKQGPNEPCACGSGLKHKKCCGNPSLR